MIDAPSVICAYRTTNEIDLSSGLHTHDFHHFLYIVEGECEATVDGAVVRMGKSNALLVPPGTPHSLVFPVAMSSRCDIFHVKCVLDDDLAASIPSGTAIDCAAYDFEMESALNLLARTVNRKPSNVERAFSSIIHYLSFAIRECCGGKAGNVEPLTDMRIKVAIAKLEDNIKASPPSTEKLAKLLGLNKSYFIRFFKKHVGVSPMEYLLKRKMEEASKMLLFSSVRISDIAAALGYSNCHHFSSQFKKHFGLPPKSYRQKLTG